MKKKYEKPIFVFEDFSLNTSIAGDCDHDTALQTQGDCGLEFGGDIIFLVGVTGCADQYETDDGTSGICYHNPTDTQKLFVS